MARRIQNGVVIDPDNPSQNYESVDIPDELTDFSDLVTALATKVDEPESPVAFTQTYSTAAAVVPAAPTNLTLTATAIAAKTASTTLTDSGTADAAAVADSLNQAQKDLGTQINTLAADVLALKKLVTQIIDILQAASLAA